MSISVRRGQGDYAWTWDVVRDGQTVGHWYTSRLAEESAARLRAEERRRQVIDDHAAGWWMARCGADPQPLLLLEVDAEKNEVLLVPELLAMPLNAGGFRAARDVFGDWIICKRGLRARVCAALGVPEDEPGIEEMETAYTGTRPTTHVG